MPIKLTVAILIIATMTPMVMDVAQHAEEEISTRGTEEQARIIMDGISDVYLSGVGSKRTIEVDIPSGDSLIFGGSGTEYIVRILTNDEEVKRLYIESPLIPVIGGETVISDRVLVTLECMVIEGTYGVRVTT